MNNDRFADSAWHRLSGYFWGILTPLICTLIDWPLQPILGEASILMTYLLGVFLVARYYGRGASITASLISAPAFAFYFASPIFSFAITDIENIIGLIVMMVVANLTSNLLDRSQSQAELARQRENRSNALYKLSLALADASTQNEVARVAVEQINQEFTADSQLWFLDQQGSLLPTTHPLPASAADLAHQLARDQAKFESDGVSYYPFRYAQATRAVIAIRFSYPLQADPALPAFLDTFRTLIAQTLERLYLAEQARKALLQVETEALRNALLSAISHDLRTPLTRINGAAATLLEAGAAISEDEKQELGKAILDEAQRMSDLTSKILDMARLSSGEITLHQDWNAIEEIVGSALTRLDSSLQDRPVRTQLSEQLPLVWLDAVLMQQVLVNLIENAIKYTPAGSPIDISAEIAGEQIQLTVTDYGAGIPPGMEEQLFEKFFRLQTETQQNGVGLGLALCRAIVKAHGGTIHAGNVAGKGAGFTIQLPVHVPPALDLAAMGDGR